MNYDQRALKEVGKRFGIRLAVLFGSHARRSPPPGPGSDVDIAVLGVDASRFVDCVSALAPVFGSGPIDLVRLETADAVLRQEIMERGVLLYGERELFDEYRAFAFRDFVDSADLRALEQTLFTRKMGRLGEVLQ